MIKQLKEFYIMLFKDIFLLCAISNKVLEPSDKFKISKMLLTSLLSLLLILFVHPTYVFGHKQVLNVK